jgi:hypothetical protein
MWDWVIRARRVSQMLPVLEEVLAGVHRPPRGAEGPEPRPASLPPAHVEVTVDIK